MKVLSLAEEAKIIRREEKRAELLKRWGTKRSLAEHRRKEVRSEARAAILAYTFLRGREYRKVEPKTRPDKPVPVSRFLALVKKYCHDMVQYAQQSPENYWKINWKESEEGILKRAMEWLAQPQISS